MAFYTLWLMIFTGVLAVSTVGLWIVTWRGAKGQARDMKESIRHAEIAAQTAVKQVETSRKALIDTDRAFVFQVNVVCRPHMHENEKDIWWSFDVEWENSGNTPTRNLNLWVFRYLEPETIPVDFGFNTTVDTTYSIKSIIGPKSRVSGSRIMIEGRDLDKVKKGEMYLSIWGWAEYNDVFEGTDRHVTRFCLMVRPLGDPTQMISDKNIVEFNMPQHPRFNCADAECHEQDRNPVRAIMTWRPTSE